MSPGRFVALLVLALAVIGGAYWLSSQRVVHRDPDFGVPVLPGLAASLDSVSAIRLIGAGESPLVNLRRVEGHWIVDGVGYRADGARIRQLLMALGALHVLEPKTRDAARYPALGVEETSAAGAQSLRIELRGPAPPVALLVGRPAGDEGQYVRVSGTAQAVEARPLLRITRDPRQWLARAILDVAPERIASIDFAPVDAPRWRALRSSRTALHVDVANLPAGSEIASRGALDGATGLLRALEFDDVRPSAGDSGSAPAARTTVRCFDGLVIDLIGHRDGADGWITVSARFDAAAAERNPPGSGEPAPGAEAVLAEATRIANTAAGWQYRIADDRYAGLFLDISHSLLPRH